MIKHKKRKRGHALAGPESGRPADFSSRYSAVFIDIEFSDRLVDVIAEGFDLVIRTGSLSDSWLTVRSLTRFKAKVVGLPGYLQRNGTPLQPTDLQQPGGASPLRQTRIRADLGAGFFCAH